MITITVPHIKLLSAELAETLKTKKKILCNHLFFIISFRIKTLNEVAPSFPCTVSSSWLSWRNREWDWCLLGSSQFWVVFIWLDSVGKTLTVTPQGRGSRPWLLMMCDNDVSFSGWITSPDPNLNHCLARDSAFLQSNVCQNDILFWQKSDWIQMRDVSLLWSNKRLY